MRSSTEIEAQFRKSGIDPKKPVITSCGSGITAAVLSLALAQMQSSEHALYDGSWSEWGSIAEMPAVSSAKS